MTKEAALLLFNSVPVTVSTICRISFVCVQARIEAEYRRAIGADDLTGIAHLEVDVWVILRRFIPNALELAVCSARLRRPIDDANGRAWIVERGLEHHPVSRPARAGRVS